MFDRLSTYQPQAIALLRIMAGLLFVTHGLQKLFDFPAAFPRDMTALAAVAGILELAGGALIVIGFVTRPTAFVLSGMMAVAYFLAHAGNSFYPLLNGGELAVLYCFVFLYISTAGPGAWSVDAARGATNLRTA